MSVFDLQEIMKIWLSLKGKARLIRDILWFLPVLRPAYEIHNVFYPSAIKKEWPIIVSALRDGPHPLLPCIGINERPGMLVKTGEIIDKEP